MIRKSITFVLTSLCLIGCTVKENAKLTTAADINSLPMGVVATLPADGEYYPADESLRAVTAPEVADAATEGAVSEAILPPSEIPEKMPGDARSIRDIHYGGPTSRLYSTSYGEMNAAYGQNLFRYGELHPHYHQWMNGAADIQCSRMGWTGGGNYQWVNPWSGQVVIACAHGSKRWVPMWYYGYAPSVNIPQVNGGYNAVQPIFNDAGAARMARHLDSRSYGGLMLQYGGGATIISLLYSGSNHHSNMQWGQTYGINFPANDPNRFIYARVLGGHFCRVHHGSIFGVVTEHDGRNDSIVIQCGK